MSMKLRSACSALAIAGVIGSGAANAAILDAWNFNLSLLNGQLLSNGNAITSANNATNIDYLNVAGESTVTQTVVGGVALGQDFTDSGYLQYLTYQKEGGAGFIVDYGRDSETDLDLTGFIQFDGLTGVLNADGSITFDPGVGSIAFWVEDDNDGNSTTGNVLKLMEFSLIAPSGGSDLDFYGGSAANSTIDLTAIVTYSLFPDLFTDSSNNAITSIAIDLVNTNSLLDDDFDPNPDNTGINGEGNGVSIIRVENAGQHKLATVPEPGVIALLGMGLLGMGVASRRRAKA